jgi:hypothetical protein
MIAPSFLTLVSAQVWNLKEPKYFWRVLNYFIPPVANFLCLVAILCGPKFVQKFSVFLATNYSVDSKYVVANGWNIFLQET